MSNTDKVINDVSKTNRGGDRRSDLFSVFSKGVSFQSIVRGKGVLCECICFKVNC